jgi:hypothetical protein
MSKTLLFGFGHLGKYIADHSQDLNVTYRDQKKIHPHVKEYIPFRIGDDLFDVSHYANIIITYPPQVGLLEFLKELYKQKKHQKIIFISSTSVYGNGEVTENSDLIGKPRSGEYLILCERFLKDRESLIIRPCGLVDNERNPAHFFKNNLIPASNHRTKLCSY